MSEKNSLRYALCVIAAAMIWGSASLFVNGLKDVGITSSETLFVRAVISTVFIAVIILLKDRRLFRIDIRDIWMFIGTGIISYSAFNYCYYEVIRTPGAGASVGVALMYTSPAFVIIMSVLFFKARVTFLKVSSVVITIVGVLLVGLPSSVPPKALVIGIVCGFGYSLYSIFGSFASRKYNFFTIIFYTFLLASFAMAVTVLIEGGNIPALLCDRDVLVGGGGLAVTGTFAYILYTFGLAHMDAVNASVLSCVEPLVGSLIGIFKFGESHGVGKIIGIFLILGSTLLVTFTNRKRVDRNK